MISRDDFTKILPKDCFVDGSGKILCGAATSAQVRIKDKEITVEVIWPDGQKQTICWWQGKIVADAGPPTLIEVLNQDDVAVRHQAS